MKILMVAMLFSIQATRVALPVQPPIVKPVAHVPHKGGTWYFAENGHAVYCYGPVVRVTQSGGLQNVATFCIGEKVMVPLRD